MSSELPDLDEAISFAVDNGAQAGPFPMRSIIESVKQGQRLPSTLVWWAGEPDWVPFNSVPGLVALTQDPVETLPPPPSGDPFGAPPAEATDATMTFGTDAAAAATEPFAEAAAEPMAAAEPVVEAAADAFEPMAAAEPVAEVAQDVSSTFADTGSPGDVIEMAGGGAELDATQVWSAPEEAVAEAVETVEPAANLVDEAGGDFSWASPEPSAADDVWTDAAETVSEAVTAEPESTEGGGLSTGLFGAGAGAAAAAAGGMLADAGDAVEDAVPDKGELGGMVEEAMPDAVSPLQSVNERIEALGAESPVASFGSPEPEPMAEEVAAAAEPEAVVEEALVEPEPFSMGAAEPVVEMAEPVAEEAFAAEPVVEEAAIEEPAVEMEPMAEPVVEEVVLEEPAAEDLVVEEAAAEEPVAAMTDDVAAEAESPHAAIFNDLLDRSAAVEADELRADRKVVVMLAGFMNVAADRGLAVLDMVATGLQHSVRFEDPADGTRTTVALGNAGSHVRMAFGFGSPVDDPGSVLTSTAWDDGPIMIGADTDDGLAFTGVDLFVDPNDYVTESHTVNTEALGGVFDALSSELRSSLLSGMDA